MVGFTTWKNYFRILSVLGDYDRDFNYTNYFFLEIIAYLNT